MVRVMLAKGHTALASVITLGLFDIVPYFQKFEVNEIGLFYGSVLVGSLFPDIDESRSYIGRKLGVISVIVSSIFKHRTFTHYLIFPIVIYFSIIGFIEDDISKNILQGFVFGMFLHTLGDMFTVGGIKGFFFPIFPNTKIWALPEFMRFYTGSTHEYILIYFLYFLNCLVLGDLIFNSWSF